DPRPKELVMINERVLLPVTEQGLVIPREWFGSEAEVMVRRENGLLVVEAVAAPEAAPAKAGPSGYDPNDPIWSWGSDPIDIGITDGSVNLDKYVYGDPHGTGQ